MAGTWDKEALDEIWKNTLLNQFHDILLGSSITWVYKDAHGISEKNLSLLRDMRTQALAALFRPIKNAKPSVFALVNTQSWTRREVITLPAPGAGGFVALDAEGNKLDTCASGSWFYAMATVPSMGYTTISLEKGDPARINHGVVCTENTLQNQHLRVRLAADGTISSIYDREARREVLSGAANRLLLWEDLPYSWDAWDVSQYYRETTPEQAKLESRKITVDTPLLSVIEQLLTVGSSAIRQRISLKKDSKLVTIENTVDWKENGKLLKVHAETSIFARAATYEIQFGQVERPTHRNTSWDEARFEVAGQRYADISEDDYGFAVVNDCKYGYSTYDNSIELSLLRSPKSPDPEADMGNHEFTYGYLPHLRDLSGSTVFETAHGLNSPLIVCGTAAAPKVREISWFSLEGGHVKLEAVKRSENGKGIVLRLYETGGGTRKVTLHSSAGWKSVVETDLLENPTSASAARAALPAGRPLKLLFKPFEIKTLYISAGRTAAKAQG